MSVATAGRPGFALLGVVQAVLIFTILILTVPLPLVARESDRGVHILASSLA
ncbi:hypothetical protein ACFZDG_13560 [Kitasatospora xanthocidica]|uniref:hypothetical protein n=1 Tax=Kitasatospora xanthocidica TaxID=83382 RepID=UPI0036E512BC